MIIIFMVKYINSFGSAIAELFEEFPVGCQPAGVHEYQTLYSESQGDF